MDTLSLINALRLKDTGSQGGLAPFGVRHGGEGLKGYGYFGALPHKAGGVATEISVSDDRGEYPLLVPTLARSEIDALLADQEPTEAMHEKALSWANMRRARGLSPFSGPTELRMPLPEVEALRKKKKD